MPHGIFLYTTIYNPHSYKTHTHTQTPDSASFCTLFFAFKSFAFILCDVVVYLLFVVNIMREIYSFVIKAKALLVVQISISSWHFQFILSDSSFLFTIATSICIFYVLFSKLLFTLWLPNQKHNVTFYCCFWSQIVVKRNGHCWRRADCKRAKTNRKMTLLVINSHLLEFNYKWRNVLTSSFLSFHIIYCTRIHWGF